ncbi:hypothetical protein E8E13_010176 [Curvularia kusanoi]|uniref:Uncharacterized protein n=1 Tax=Curvularia kusanoi TaxID=90978 RepID=A0A9P4WDG0_CURKU|nr:hypothetical protein E8E13_010176 [Curvularia kusanoi]
MGLTQGPRYIPPQARTAKFGSSDLSSARTRSESPHETLSQRPSCSRSSESQNWRQLSRSWPGSPAPFLKQDTPPICSKPDQLKSNWRKSPVAPSAFQCWTIGQVAQLPDEHQIPASSIARTEARGDPWLHPVLITETGKTNGIKTVKVRVCTSMGGRGLEAKPEHLHKYFLKATRSRLTETSGDFHKETFVNCSPTAGSEFTIEAALLLPYRAARGRAAIEFNEAAMAEIANLRPQFDSAIRSASL